MRPVILTGECLAEIDAKAALDAIERIPTDDGIIRDVYREMWPRAEPRPAKWDEWVRLP